MTAVEYITMLGEYYHMPTEQTAKMLQARDEIEQSLAGFYPEDVRNAIEDYARTVDKRFAPKLRMLLIYLTTPENNIPRDWPIDSYFNGLARTFLVWWNQPNMQHSTVVESLTEEQIANLRKLTQAVHDYLAHKGIKNLSPITIAEEIRSIVLANTVSTIDELLDPSIPGKVNYPYSEF